MTETPTPRVAWFRRPTMLIAVTLTLPFVLMVFFNLLSAVWLETSSHAAELGESIGKNAQLREANGAVTRGVLCAADPVFNNGALRFRVTLVSCQTPGPRSFRSVILDPWEVDKVQIDETQNSKDLILPE